MYDMFQAALTWLRSRDERGATAVKYGMLVALIAAVIVAIVAMLGTSGQHRVHGNLGRAPVNRRTADGPHRSVRPVVEPTMHRTIPRLRARRRRVEFASNCRC